MKKIVLLILLLSSINVFSQTEKTSIDSISKKICKSWKLKEIKFNGKPMPVNLTLDIKYLEDKTFEMNAIGKIENGKWEIKAQNKEYLLIVNKTETINLISVDDNLFVISRDTKTSKESSSTEKIEYSFEPNDSY